MQGKVNYGTQLFKGEGQAYAHYIQEGKRIPRRGKLPNSHINTFLTFPIKKTTNIIPFSKTSLKFPPFPLF